MARAILGVALVFLSACGPNGSQPRSENQLELELGGTHPSLRGALPSARSEPTVPPATPANPPPAAAPTTPPAASAPPARERPQPAPVELESARRPSRSARLEPGQTVIGIVREALGDDRRLAEVLALNGWTEAQARRLSAGTVVKLPPR